MRSVLKLTCSMIWMETDHSRSQELEQRQPAEAVRSSDGTGRLLREKWYRAQRVGIGIYRHVLWDAVFFMHSFEGRSSVHQVKARVRSHRTFRTLILPVCCCTCRRSNQLHPITHLGTTHITTIGFLTLSHSTSIKHCST